VDAYYNRSIAWTNKADYDKAIADCTEAIRIDPKCTDAYYNKARCLALQGKTEPSLQNLRKAFEVGFRNVEYLEKDRSFDSIRDDPDYKKLLKEYRK
jgi:tetratricopeptide (TPR) repeat protein